MNESKPPPPASTSLPPRLERPRVHGQSGHIGQEVLSPRPSSLGVTIDVNESTWLRDDDFIYEAYYTAANAKKAKSSGPALPRSVQNALLHKQCTETIEHCKRTLQERRDQMAALSLPFTPLRKKPSSLRKQDLTTPDKVKPPFDSTLSPNLTHDTATTAVTPKDDVCKRLSFADATEDSTKSSPAHLNNTTSNLTVLSNTFI
ncbi:hypothetical protein AC1031_000710 [Aphanomyces cochlioides]|nr:hypothetical protein AC1031_000710 [Aphanomyces cochlioides]